MADNEPQQTFIENKDLILADGNVELSSNENEKRLNNIASSDILQRALDEAGGYGQTLHSHSSNQNIERINDNIKHLTDHSYIHPCTSTVNSPSDNFDSSKENTFAEKDKPSDLEELQLSNVSQMSNTQEMDSSLILNSQNEINMDDSGMGRLNIVEDSGIVNNVMSNASVTKNETDVLSSNSCSVLSSTEHQTVSVAKQNILSPLITSSSSSPSSSQSSSNVIDLKFLIKQSDAPIGSVENPMQIIHNGNSFHSTQVLTPEQLQQIKLVLQREHAKKLANGKSSVLFDPNTRTRLFCRIVHPSELRSKTIQKEATPRQTAQVCAVGRGRGRPKKFSGRQLEDEERGNSALSKEERDEKKKHRPRTRSGRISKPPSYMVKDYKRIHHLDFNDEGNESDGGYSDYHVSDEEKDAKGSKSNNLPPGVTTSKQRSYPCISCNKAYIGRGGLSRHYRLNPSHGSMPEGADDISTQDETSNSSFASSILSSSGGNTNSQNNLFSPTNSFKSELEQPPPPPVVQQPLRSLNARDHPMSDERRVRLKEILKTYSTTELVDAFLPKFAQDVSMWKFFTAKCQKPSEGLSIFEMLKEFEKFLLQMQRISLTCLTQASEADQGKTIINISSKQIAEALSLERGSFAVKDDGTVSANLKMMEYPLANIAAIPNMNPNTTDTIFHPYLKRKRNDLNEVDVNAGLPDQILSDAHENSTLDLPIAEETMSESTNIHQPQTDLLSSCMEKIDPQNEIPTNNLFDLNSSTTVTPSSLSSGCLSAVNSTHLPKGYMFAALSDAQQYQNMQIKKVRLLETVLQNQLSPKMTPESSTSSINGFPLTTDCNLGDLVTSSSSPIVQSQDCTSAMVNPVFSLATDILNPCPEYSQVNSQRSTVQSASFVNSLHTTLSEDSHKVSTSSENFTNCLNVVPMENPNASINNSEVQTCMQNDVPPPSTDIVTQAYQASTSDIVSDAIKVPPVLRQVMLPGGQLINVWSNALNSDKSSLEQALQGYLPGNLLVLQNTDGSVQVPQTQGTTLETLRALVTSDASTEQAGSLVHDS